MKGYPLWPGQNIHLLKTITHQLINTSITNCVICSCVILAHNHPSGNTQPSDADKAITKRLVDALGLLDIRVLDHLVVGHDDVLSFAEIGLI